MKNRFGKVIIYLWLIATFTLLFLHNPTEGYENTSYVIDALESKNPLAEKKCFSKEGSAKIYCIHDRPILVWQSKGAVIDWFAKVGNIIWSLGFVSVLAFCTFLMFGRANKNA